MKLTICLFQKKDDELLQKYNEIWQYEFDSKPIYNERYLKVKIKSSNGEINTNLHNNKLSKKGLQDICLSVILLGSIFRTGKNYYPQVF